MLPSIQNPYGDLLLDDLETLPADKSGKHKLKKAKTRRKHVLVDENSGGEGMGEAENAPIFRGPVPSPLVASPSFSPVHGITSPVLSALAANTVEEAAFDTTAWANNVPFGSSPSNAVASVAGSPANNASLSPLEEIRGGFSSVSPAVSPGTAYRLPVRRASGYQDYLPSSPRGRPLSVPNNQIRGVPLPHKPQAHYRGISDADIGMLQPRSNSMRTATVDFSAFDTLSHSGDAVTTSADDVLLVAADHSIAVYKMERDRLEIIGRVTGLRGKVVSAKILPSVSRDDALRSKRPLVVVISHGPRLVRGGCDTLPGSIHHRPEGLAPSSSMLEVLESAGENTSLSTTEFQTTVEVYSLRTHQRVATLYKSPPVVVDLLTASREPPFPVGSLSTQVHDRFVVVASGTSGEVYIFEAVKGVVDQPFRCIGKTWTSTPSRRHRSWSMSTASSEAESSHDGSPARASHTDAAIFAVGHRWLAVVPPGSSNQAIMHAQIDLPRTSSTREIPGLSSHTSPSLPQITCELETPLEESRLNRVARDATQEVLKGARWAGEQGMHYWKNYWNKPSEPGSPVENVQQQPQFPPTHAHDDRNRVRQEPAMVSILDLQKLADNQDAKPGVALQPVATFPMPGGCSFLSFNPNGLSLFTASAKGDVFNVWCLMRLIHGQALLTSVDGSPGNVSPSVRQIARFSRITTANLVDVVWAAPKGEKLAILTDRGTVHMHDMPASAYRWPPSTENGRPASSQTHAITEAASRSAGGALGAALNLVSSTAQPIVAAVRNRPALPTAIPSFSGLAAGAGAKGGKLMASGLSKSMGAATGTVSAIRHMGENRLSIPRFSKGVSEGTVRWLSSKYQDAIAVTGGGTVLIHAVRLSTKNQGAKAKQSVVGEKVGELAIPKEAFAATDAHNLPNDGLALDGCWPAAQSAAQHRHAHIVSQPLSIAEIETSVPYQPFESHRRVNCEIFENAHHHLDDSAAWIFGDSISTKPIVNDAEEDMDNTTIDHRRHRFLQTGTYQEDEEDSEGQHDGPGFDGNSVFADQEADEW